MHHHDRATIIDRAAKYLAKIPPAVSGQGGHSATFHAASVLVKGFALSIDDASPLLAEWNQSCQPPWSEHELRHKLDDAAKQPGPRGELVNAEKYQGGAWRNEHAPSISIGTGTEDTPQ